MAIDVQRTRPLMSNPTGRAVDRLFDETFAPFYGGRESDAGTQSLPVTIWETDDAFYAAFLAPGLEEDSINVTVQEETLSVAGELKLQSPVGARMIWPRWLAPEVRVEPTSRVKGPRAMRLLRGTRAVLTTPLSSCLAAWR